MDFNDAAQLARSLIAGHGLRKWTFRYNRGKRTLGLCDYTRRRIELSRYFVAHNDEPAVRDTILHEIAHALAGEKAGHGPKWQAICQRIGAVPERLDRTAVMPKGHWAATCPGCGTVHRRFRRPLLGRTYICKSCGPDKGALQFGIPARVLAVSPDRHQRPAPPATEQEPPRAESVTASGENGQLPLFARHRQRP